MKNGKKRLYRSKVFWGVLLAAWVVLTVFCVLRVRGRACGPGNAGAAVCGLRAGDIYLSGAALEGEMTVPAEQNT